MAFIDMVIRNDAEWVIEMLGFVGMINILGIEHLVVIASKNEVC